MTTKPVVAAFMLFFVLLLSSCVPSARQAPFELPPDLPTPTYQFLFEPEPQENPIEATIALINPQYGTTLDCAAPSENFNTVVENYSRSLERDFEATLIAKGYTLTGPFTSIEDMTFGQKERAMLALQPMVNLTVSCDDAQGRVYSSEKNRDTGRTVSTPGQGRGERFVVQDRTVIEVPGQMIVKSDLSLEMTEPLSQEKVWQKAVPVEDQQSAYDYYAIRETDKYLDTQGRSLTTTLIAGAQYQELETRTNALPNADKRPGVLASILEQMYQTQLSQFSAFFDPREIEIVVGDAERARERY